MPKTGYKVSFRAASLALCFMKADTLDIEQPDLLTAYLRDAGHVPPHEQPEICPLSGGVSNRTVLVRRSNGEAWVIKQALAKLRVKVDWFSSPERIHREAEGLRWLARLAPPGSVPGFVFEDHVHHLLAMQAVPQPHDNWKQRLLDGKLNMDHVNQFGTLLGTIQRRAYEVGEPVREAFSDSSFFESLRLEPYYAYTASQLPEAAPFLHTLIADTRASRFTLTHGDFSPKNVLVHHNRLILLDHEVIHFGDPAFDIGFSMTHLLSKAHHVTALRGAFAQAANRYWQTYVEHVRDLPWYDGLEARAVRHTLACLLARVDGRSPLEYLDSVERLNQRQAVLRVLPQSIDTLPTLIEAFIDEI